jgi:hypothetical protein
VLLCWGWAPGGRVTPRMPECMGVGPYGLTTASAVPASPMWSAPMQPGKADVAAAVAVASPT